MLTVNHKPQALVAHAIQAIDETVVAIENEIQALSVLIRRRVAQRFPDPLTPSPQAANPLPSSPWVRQSLASPGSSAKCPAAIHSASA